MSLMFKPKISGDFRTSNPTVKKVTDVFHFASGKLAPKVKTVPRELVHWTTKELKQLVELKAMGVTYQQISKLMTGRSANSCGGSISSNGLTKVYKKRRQEMIEEIMND